MAIDAEPDDIEWLPSMEAEISGFGDDHWEYEQACRDMVIAGARWLAEHPDAEPEVSGDGVVQAENDDGEALIEAITDPAVGPSGAMVRAAVQHTFYIIENGWDAYVELMQEPKEEDDV